MPRVRFLTSPRHLGAGGVLLGRLSHAEFQRRALPFARNGSVSATASPSRARPSPSRLPYCKPVRRCLCGRCCRHVRHGQDAVSRLPQRDQDGLRAAAHEVSALPTGHDDLDERPTLDVRTDPFASMSPTTFPSAAFPAQATSLQPWMIPSNVPTCRQRNETDDGL